MMTQNNQMFRVEQIPEGYKKSGAGVIPASWKYTTIKSVTISHKQGYYSTESYSNSGIKLARITDLKNPEIDFESMPLLPISEKDYNFYKINVGDILLARSGAIGRYGIVRNAEVAVFASYIIRFSLDNSQIDNDYFGYVYQSETVQKQLLTITQGSSNININAGNIKSLEVLLPELNEQQKIATALSDTDALISELEKLIEKKQAIKTATMQQLLTGKTRLPEFALREDGMPKAYKESELGPIPEDWSVMQLDQICDVVDPHPSHRAPPEVSNGIPFLGIGDFDTDGNIIKSKLRLVDKSIYDEHSKRYDLNKNLLGLGRVASIGKVIRLKNGMGKYTISPTLGILQSNSVDTDFLYYFLQSNKVSEQFSKVMSGSTRSSVGMIVLRQLNIIVPSTNESYCIGQLLKAIEDDIRSVSEKINKLKALKQGMMQELLTGKTRLV